MVGCPHPGRHLNGWESEWWPKRAERQFRRGAEEALRLCRMYGCEAALLKERSPSCGHGVIHNGLFNGGLVEGDGVTAELLLQNGIAVYRESEWEMLL